MNNKILISYINKNATLEGIQKILDNGDIPICGRCKSKLIIALDIDSARDKGVHPGIYCPKNENHFSIMVEIWDEDTKKFYNECIKKKTDQ